MKNIAISVFNNQDSLSVFEVPIHGIIAIVDYFGETKIITKLSNQGITETSTIQQFFELTNNWKYLGQTSELELIEENGVSGWRLYNRNPNDYGDIGKDAIDFSITDGGYPLSGASGERSFATGFNSHAMGNYSHCEGLTTIDQIDLIVAPVGLEGSYTIYGAPEGSYSLHGVPEGSYSLYGVPA